MRPLFSPNLRNRSCEGCGECGVARSLNLDQVVRALGLPKTFPVFTILYLQTVFAIMTDLPDDNPNPWIEPPLIPFKGRGALTNLPGRFEEQIIARADDGWWQEADEPGAPRTIVTPDLMPWLFQGLSDENCA